MIPQNDLNTISARLEMVFIGSVLKILIVFGLKIQFRKLFQIPRNLYVSG